MTEMGKRMRGALSVDREVLYRGLIKVMESYKVLSFPLFLFSKLCYNPNMKKTDSNVNDSYPCKMGKGKKEV